MSDLHPTPGLWSYDADFGEIQSDDGILVAIVAGPHTRGIDWAPNDDERRDNGYLLGAARELHEALLAQERVSEHGQTCPVCTDPNIAEADVQCQQFTAMWEYAEALRTKALNKALIGRPACAPQEAPPCPS